MSFSDSSLATVRSPRQSDRPTADRNGNTETDLSAKSVSEVVEEQSQRVLETYRIDPGLIQEHANGERRINQGGYGERQVYELVQNGADEMRDLGNGEIRVILTDQFLYCANTGNPITPEGADTILRMSVSRKRGGQIGRFGVGVKSVLSVSDAPQFFSTTGSFGFDREWAERTIRAIVPNAIDIPVLRMARPIDAEQAAVQDPLLAELLTRAATVVRLPLLPGSAQRLSQDLRNFPSEFQLFSPHVASLYLEDRSGEQPVIRELYVRRTATVHTLQALSPEGKRTTTEWHVFRRTHSPSDAALASAGELHDRPEIDIAWAVPSRGFGDRGTFWAYFPTNYATTLRGLLNAPWKTSEDRQNLFDHNAFNDELIEQAARLVVESLPELVDPTDPGSYLMLLPGRGREAPQWADERLTNAVWRAAASLPSLPDQDGKLRRPAELQMPPENMSDAWLKLWADYPGRPVDWTHKSIENRERRAKARLIFDRAKRGEATAREWLEALVSDGSAEASARAIQIAAGMVSGNHEQARSARSALIVLTELSGMVSVDGADVFQRSGQDELADDLVYVDPRVTDVIGVRSALDTLGVHEASPIGRLTAVLEKGFAHYRVFEWEGFWKLCRRMTPRDAAAAIAQLCPDWWRILRLRTCDGTYRRPIDCLLPGRVVPADGSRDQSVAVDLRVHSADRPVLEALGMSDVPVASGDPRREAWFEEYRASAFNLMCAKLPAGVAHPRMSSFVVDGANPPGPLGMLKVLSDEAKYLFIKNLPASQLVHDWSVRTDRHTGRVVSPLVWMVRRYGVLQSSQGLIPAKLAVGPSLSEYRAALPVALIDRGVADLLGLPATVDQIPARLWRHLVNAVATTEEDAVPGTVYALVLRSEADWPGGETRCRIGVTWGTRPDDQICVTSSREEYDSLVLESVPALLAPTPADVEAMVETWGMRRYATTISTELRKVEETEPVAVVAEYPHLRILRGSRANGWSFVQCSELEEVKRTPHGMRTSPLEVAAREAVVYVRHSTDKRWILQAISREIDLRLSLQEVEIVLARSEEAKNQEVLKQVRATKNTVEKILLLIGAERLRRGLPEGLLAWEEACTGAPVGDRRIAELALHAHGDGILRHHREDLGKAHEALAVGFTGDRKSQSIVTDLGLPNTFAGVREEQPLETEHVFGPTPHFPLHDYQEKLAGRMHRLLMQERPERAMLSLPTGAGKTRIAVEAVIRYLKEYGSEGPGGPILWIAQSEELCEQAVQSWRYVWEKVGVGGTRLTVSRFWSTRDASPVTDNPHLVIATDDKLTYNLEKPTYAWLRQPALVIVDEAHGSTTKSYTRLLEQLGLTQYRTTRPLIGLTATPFRGKNSAETSRLVSRYGNRRLDKDVFGDDAYRTLQNKGVLARVDHSVLEGGQLTLTDSEVSRMSQLRGGTLPPEAERRLADDQVRNDALIKALLGLDRDWPILVFATSVNHARFLAAVLNDQGITAAAVDSQTPTARRRRIVEQFGRGRIRVLTNYGVLHQGFDAPATRAVVVARPTYSPNVYQQMIGRGLRGPANGGTDRCLILNVRDNIVNYGEELAFTEFEKMWTEP
ncbi:DEAD/DEAH box helicase family protein [Micromonospora sp. NPDC126480]|uniref:DEAD/DEAH box helicase family protein n=1 Tax=Micromonospora sp. NPDC126480 TaxID=3155312 RepID=UPI00331757A7